MYITVDCVVFSIYLYAIEYRIYVQYNIFCLLISETIGLQIYQSIIDTKA